MGSGQIRFNDKEQKLNNLSDDFYKDHIGIDVFYVVLGLEIVDFHSPVAIVDGDETLRLIIGGKTCGIGSAENHNKRRI